MEDSSGSGPGKATTTAVGSSARQQANLKHRDKAGTVAKATGKALTGWLPEPEPPEDDSELGGTQKRRTNQKRPWLSLHCQVDGCGLDLAQARKYFQRYRVCERHLKSPSLQIDDRSVRFCDQCSKFHDISMFEGTHRTCKEKLERTRQARSDKRRQQTEQAKRAAMHASGGGRSQLQGTPRLQREHGQVHDYDDLGDDESTLANCVYVQQLKRNKLQPLHAAALPLTAVGPMVMSGPTAPAPVVASPLHQHQAPQGIKVGQRTALAAAMAGGAGGGAWGCAEMHRAGHGQGPVNVVGNREGGGDGGGGGSSGGGSSSRSTWDDGHPHLQLLRMDSVCSPFGSTGGSHVSYALGDTGPAIGGGSTGGTPALCDLNAGWEVGPVAARHAAWTGAGVPTAAQTAAILRELYGFLDGGGDVAGHRATIGNRGLMPAKGVGAAPRDIRSFVETPLRKALSARAPNRRPGHGDGEAPHAEILPGQACIRNGVKLHGCFGSSDGRGVGSRVRSDASVEQLLFEQLQAVIDDANDGRAEAHYDGARLARGFSRDVAAGMGPQRPQDDLYDGAIAAAAAVRHSDGDLDEESAVALRRAIATLVAGRGGPRTQPVAVTTAAARPAGTLQEPLSSELISLAWGAGRSAGRSAHHTGVGTGIGAIAADPGDHTNIRGLAPRFAATGLPMPVVLDLAAIAVPAAARAPWGGPRM